jgi:pyrroline-5-carboxylate reductase
MKITVIGAGNMGGALAKGWAKAITSGKAEGLEVTVADRAVAALEKIGGEFPVLHTTSSNTDAVKGADIVMLAVKPWLVEIVANEIKDVLDYSNQIIVSIAAGVTTEKLSAMLDKDGNVPSTFYVIPNIAAEYGASMSFVSAAKGVSAEKIAQVEELFGFVGDTKVVEEKLVAPGMMMASCGIAYVMRYLRAQMEGGVEMGFYPADALDIALQTMQGAVSLLKETGWHPEVAIDKVTTPGGVTIKGLNELDHSGFNSAVIRSLKAGLK